MLQQTQVATVIPYWQRWMAKFPTVEQLASTDDEQALAAWQGLGYYRRCRNLLGGARFVAAQGFPNSVEGWRNVPGVGRYTAGAIASIAQGIPAAVVDGNVERVYARLEMDSATGSALTKNTWSWAEANLPNDRPGEWNQALMELGATVCTPARPRCPDCPLRQSCLSGKASMQADFPVQAARQQTVRQHHRTYILCCEDRLGVRRIPEGQWWQGMYEFPRESADEPIAELEGLDLTKLGEIRHAVTHHKILLEVLSAEVGTPIPDFEWKTEVQLGAIPMPSPQRRALALWRKCRLQKTLQFT